jgi:Carboxypeptidase regulatory-like domain
MRVYLLVLAVLICCSARNTTAQQTPPPATSTNTNSNAAETAKPAQQSPAPGPCSPKTKLRPGFLIVGTVFNEHALSFPGATVRIRCADDQKYRWETTTNSRGEFAVRVPEGHAYEVQVRVKNYVDQNVPVRTSQGDIQQRLSIRLQPIKPEKAGAAQ